MKRSGNVDEYISAVSAPVQEKLREMRAVIKAVAPHAEERISYGMPFYQYGGSGYKGRLAYFASFKKHISLFVPPPVVAEHAKELKNYQTTKSAVHFPMDTPLPVALIKKLVRARLKKNQASG